MKDLVSKVLEVVDVGLCRGVGNPEPGGMCVEGAVCYALGEPHGDKPSCVHAVVRAFVVRLNDAEWISDAGRAVGMRRLAIAQLGSNRIDGVKFAQIVAFETTRQIICRLAGEILKRDDLAESCGKSGTLKEAQYASEKVRLAACYATPPAYAVEAAAYAAARVVEAAAYAAVASRYAAARAAVRAADSAVRAGRIEYLLLSAKIGEQALLECGSPGCDYLFLCD